MTNKLLTQNINRIWSSLIVDEFLKNNITQFYLSPGMRNAPLIAALTHFKTFNPNIQLIVCMDERAAAYRALGFSKATHLPSVLVCTSGTALANYMPAVVEAKKSNVPLIILSADRPSELTFCDDNQTIDQTKFYGHFIQGEMNLGAATEEITPQALTTSLSNLIHKSLYPEKGPVHFNCAFREPLEATETKVAEKYIQLSKTQMELSKAATTYVDSSTTPPESSIKEIARLLEDCRHGLIVVGALSHQEDKSVIASFITKLGWPTYFDVSSSLKYSFNLNDGALPTFDHPEFQEILKQNPPKVVFHIGGRLTSKHYYTFLKQVPEINLITLNHNAEKEDPSHHTKIRINASIRSTLLELTHKMATQSLKPLPPLNDFFKTFTQSKIQFILSGPLSYPSVSKTIIDHIPDRSILYLGNSTVVRSFDAYFTYDVKKSLTIVTNRGVSGIEGFIASSVGFMDGVKKDLTLVIGDVAFFHDLNSLVFLKELPYKIKIILVNNDGGGIFTLLPINKEKAVLDIITSPHGLTFEKAAELFDIHYQRVTTIEQFRKSFSELYKTDRHEIVEVQFNHDTNKSVYDQLKTIKL
jgi:2-succinyl-5-enolpyruvyl-6-hydroxy-3-cyclohexene-1-carboxylate synthase